ncbi:MAG: hypothetical protein MJ041_00775 [Acidaminococcaceae bacterium]|nr:hypothetical protein [Acidaminococcaceae bacterium]
MFGSTFGGAAAFWNSVAAKGFGKRSHTWNTESAEDGQWQRSVVVG